MLSPGSLNMNGVAPRADDLVVGRTSSRLAAHLLHAVDAGAERLLARAGEHDAAHVVVAAQRRATASCSSRCISELNALCTSGRFSVTHATPSRSSYSERLEARDRMPPAGHARRCASMPGFIVLKW